MTNKRTKPLAVLIVLLFARIVRQFRLCRFSSRKADSSTPFYITYCTISSVFCFYHLAMIKMIEQREEINRMM